MIETTVIEKPMLFSGPMVRAILEGRKTQTRRIMKPEPTWCGPDDSYGQWNWKNRLFWAEDSPRDFLRDYARFTAPHPVGSRIWVRESIAIGPENHGWGKVIYKATHSAGLEPKCEGFTAWKPSIHMPRWASRITLEVTDVRVQRLQEISRDDSIAEGLKPDGAFYHGGTHPIKGTPKVFYIPEQAFESIWKEINGPDSWQANPWIWAYAFRRVQT